MMPTTKKTSTSQRRRVFFLSPLRLFAGFFSIFFAFLTTIPLRFVRSRSDDGWVGGGGRVGFVRRDGALFRNADTGERFVALGANAFALLYEENGRESGQEMVERVLDGAKTSGANVLRVWAFLDGDREEFDGRALQRNVGEFSEHNFKGLDRLLEKCESATSLKRILGMISHHS